MKFLPQAGAYALPAVLPAILAGVLGSANHAQTVEEISTTPVVPQRMLYVWDMTIPGDRSATQTLIRFARKRNIDVLAMNAYPVGYLEPFAVEDYTAFVDAIHGAGMEVYALGGDPWFTVSSGSVAGQPASHDEGWFVYQNIVDTGLFDGILDNSQVFLTSYNSGGSARNYFWDDLEVSSQDYMDWLEGLNAVCGSLPFMHAVPAWFDSDSRLQNLLLAGSAAPASLCTYVSRSVDMMNVLAYRDDALSILQFADGELQESACMLGIETQDRGASLDYTTFFEEGLRRMNVELRSVSQALAGNPNFRGFSFHYYRSFQAFGGSSGKPQNFGPPVNTNDEGPIILRPKVEEPKDLGSHGRRNPLGVSRL